MIPPYGICQEKKCRESVVEILCQALGWVEVEEILRLALAGARAALRMTEAALHHRGPVYASIVVTTRLRCAQTKISR
jgi:hypothetical protein